MDAHCAPSDRPAPDTKFKNSSPRGLAIVRCGDASLHRSWSEGRCGFDLGISYYGSDPHREFPEADYVHRYRGGKWDGLHHFFKQFPELIDRYDLFWLPDDDIAAVAADIDRLFEIGAAAGFHVFQPALSDRSYYSHLITLRHPSFEVRYTNFVEVMVPCISREILIRSLPLLGKTASGFGIDFLWPQMVQEIRGEAYQGLAIIDTVTVCHTRPVGGSLHQFMRAEKGRSAMDEMTTVIRRVKGSHAATINGLRVPRIRILSGTTCEGYQLAGLSLARRVGWDLLYRLTNRSQPVQWFAALKHAMKAGL